MARADRVALAAKLVAELKGSDKQSIQQLERLGDDAFEPVLHRFVRLYKLKEQGRHYDPDESKLRSAVWQLLRKLAKPSRTKDIFAASQALKSGSVGRADLYYLLGSTGDPKVVTPLFIKELARLSGPHAEPYTQTTDIVSEYILGPRDPRAVAFLLKVLRDPRSNHELRYQAYISLARHEGAAYVQAALAERHRRRLLRPIAQRAIDGILTAGEWGPAGTRFLSVKRDGHGRTWGLFESGALGSTGDLWLAEKTGGRWVKPLFTGVSITGISRWIHPNRPEPLFAGRTAKQLAAGDWVTALVGNPELSKDSDGDGLTDIEERRLGTDPRRRDMDGDGDPDEVDPWPNAPLRPLSDAEQILDAAFEARFHDDESEGPALFMAVRGMKPFEMVGRKGPTMWVAAEGYKEGSHPLEVCYEQGEAVINFEVQNPAGRRWEDRLIIRDAKRNDVKVLLSLYYGGTNGTIDEITLKKLRNRWVVIGIRLFAAS